ncbi:alcohol dehydrogenase catalytic domain-containing protein [Ornithinibacillus sp. L9]|uniref:Alcohol dehydrogenase catalytic domain-containing protein n=1 Tax=Ornithinibacillus caprae TaxID=2678566 RepID=A0A6N8FCM1_9BACI|nr:alcohol dehydrogenase catalytic domain-containing protein [Ornithinibacillus caprae]MUK86921.1 alcohol dehydrogenase catalytic domain-containing protein [Ornithinibacillus caprae]
MKELQFDYKLPRYVFSKAAGRFMRSQYWNSNLSCLRFREGPEPELPNEDWIKVKVKYGGICGSDLNLIFLHDSPAISTYASFPFTIGHEIVGEISETGKKVNGFYTGERVVIDPILSCEPRGFSELCPACRQGNFSLCLHKTEGSIAPGLLIGSCRDTGGGWSSYVVAHKSQVLKLPDKVEDLNGAMVEPFSCALHSVLQNPPSRDDTVLVIGGGVIGICVIAAMRALDLDCKIVALVKHEVQGRFASDFGADEIIFLRNEAYTQELAKSLGGKVLKPIFGPEVIQGGANIVYECVGRKQSINDGIRFSRTGGRVVLVGLAGIIDGIDWSMVWLNELDIKGSFAYSTEDYQGKRVRTFDIAIELMRLGKVDLSPLITHRYALEDFKTALQTAANKGSRAAMKVVFQP